MSERGEESGSEEKARAAKEREVRGQGLAYQAALEAVFAILICAGGGYWVDSRLGTSPWGLVVGTVIGFTSFVLRLLRLGRQLEARAGEAGHHREEKRT